MNNKIQELLKDNLVIKIFQSFIVICFVFLAVIVWKFPTLPPELPMYYSLPRGSEQLGSPLEFLLLPLLSILVFALHFIMAIFVLGREKVAAKILMVSALVTTVTLLLTFIRIVILIT